MRFLVSKGRAEEGLTTGSIAEGIGRRRDKAGYASVNRSLMRLSRVGLVVVFEPGCRQWGSAFFYWATDAARDINWSAGE